ncbi:type I methionyl aminopeptidase [Candidatus Saccharibacteria bacterium]|nr:type I methionyl aminopeptidase [Candidatus Saccharibacteria bacterium]MCB9821297.1 type I methionyl aminopeptidase [Candidatus Nomurabacteria bacterium]
MGRIKTDQQIAAMRESGLILTSVLDMLTAKITPGISGKELAKMARDEIKRLGGEPAFLGVKNMPGLPDFPDVICISIADEVQHGIPSERIVNEGDAVNLDLGVRYKDMITDAGRTVCAGQPSKDVARLINGTKEALAAGLKQVKAGAYVSDISEAIEAVLERHRLGIVLELVGHGVGEKLHEDPEIPNYLAYARPYQLQAGETIAIEPIATLGSGQIYIHEDGWTILSADRTQASQHEHTVLVTDKGYEIIAR